MMLAHFYFFFIFLSCFNHYLGCLAREYIPFNYVPNKHTSFLSSVCLLLAPVLMHIWHTACVMRFILTSLKTLCLFCRIRPYVTFLWEQCFVHSINAANMRQQTASDCPAESVCPERLLTFTQWHTEGIQHVTRLVTCVTLI